MPVRCTRPRSARWSCGAKAATVRPRESPRSVPLARADAGAPTRELPPPVRSEVRTSSFRLSFHAIEQFTNGIQFVGRSLAAGQRLHDEFCGRSSERAVHEIGEQLALRPLFAVTRLINVRSLRLVADHQTLFGHDL